MYSFVGRGFILEFYLFVRSCSDLRWWVRKFSAYVGQAIVDVLSLELPKAASRLADVSDRCSEVAGNVIDQCVSLCNPRDMLPILCDVCWFRIRWYGVPVVAY